MKINQIMTRNVQTLRPDQSIRDAATLMARIDTGALLVHEYGRLVGMVTDRDITLRAVAQGLDADTPVRRIMSSGVRYCFDDEDVQQVARNMAHNQMRRLPVLNREKRLVGVVSLGNIASTFSDRAQSTVLLGVAQATECPAPAKTPRSSDLNLQSSQLDAHLASSVHSLKVLTVNTHKGFTLFNRRFILPELRDAVRSISADIVFLQEVHGTHEKHALRFPDWPATSQYEFLADSMWSDFAYGRNAVYQDGDHGNALLSKFPILRYQNLDVSISGPERRGLLHCELQVPGHDAFHAICVHLGLREAHRQQQLGLLCELISSLPPDAPVVVAGDFNDWRLKASPMLERGANMHEAFAQAHGIVARSFPAHWPLLRLDRVYVRNATTRNPQVLSNRPWSHLSDHVPLAVEIHL